MCTSDQQGVHEKFRPEKGQHLLGGGKVGWWKTVVMFMKPVQEVWVGGDLGRKNNKRKISPKHEARSNL
jgi:hypothetical protein